MKKTRDNFGACYASPRPWRIETVTRQGHAVIKAADNVIVCVCHADNAEQIINAVNKE